MDCPLSVADDLKKQLKLYKLRSKVKIKDTTALYDVLVMGVHDPWQVSSTENSGKGSHSPVAASSAAAAPRQPYNDGDDDRLALFEDPRSAKLGRRLIRPKAGNGERFSQREAFYLPYLIDRPMTRAAFRESSFGRPVILPSCLLRLASRYVVPPDREWWK